MSDTTSTALAAEGGGSRAARAAAALRRASGALLGGSDRAVDRRNALSAFGIRVASAAILLGSQVLLARWMGANEYGIYVLAWSLLLMLGASSTLGLNIGAIRIVSELRAKGADDALRGFLVGGRVVVVLAAGVITLAALAIVWKLAPADISGTSMSRTWGVVAIVLLAAPAYALTDVQDGIGRGGARIGSALLAPYVVRPLLILAGLAAALGCGISLDAKVAAIVAVAATWAACGFQAVWLARDLRRIVPPGPRIYLGRSWAATAAPLAVMGLFDITMQNIDVILISSLLSPTEAGIYFAPAKMMALILFVHYAVGSAMANRFAALSAKGDAAGLEAAVREAVRWTFWPSLALAAVLLLAGRHLLQLFGPQFVDGYPVMCVLAAAILVRSAIGPAEQLLNMSGGQADTARSLIAALATNIAVGVTLTPMLGILGAAIALAMAIITGAAMNWRAARRRLGIDIGVWAGMRR